MKSYKNIVISAVISLLMFSDITQGMYSTNGSYIKVSHKHHKHGGGRQYQLLALKDEFDDESSTIEEDEDVNQNNGKVDLFVSDFTGDHKSKKDSQNDEENQEVKQEQGDQAALAEGQRLRSIAKQQEDAKKLAELNASSPNSQHSKPVSLQQRFERNQQKNGENQEFAKFNSDWDQQVKSEKVHDDDAGSFSDDYDFSLDNIASYSKKITDLSQVQKKTFYELDQVQPVKKFLSDDDILNEKTSNTDLWADSDVAEFYNINSNRIMDNKAPISAAQQDKADASLYKENIRSNMNDFTPNNLDDLSSWQEEQHALIKEKIHDQATAMKYSKIANQLKEEDSGEAERKYEKKALSQFDDDNDVSEYYDFDD